MVYVKFVLLAIIDLVLTIFTVPLAALIIPAFTRAQPHGLKEYKWGWIWGTYDNPPQGDEGFVAKRAPFVGVTTGFKGYVNRAAWMIRNPLYGFAKRCGLTWDDEYTIVITGNPNISDKYKIPGSMLAKLYDGKKLIGFEYYLVKPWSDTKDLRMRMGWKLTTDKVQQKGFAQFVCTANPFDGYGND